ncbi:hypothetical protein BJY52DRAFT_1286995 [Lactarius psammicola]|nr:hypothetical protein BJY52DRAFT_1286995 [Lactarius psammicola]
MEPGSRTTREQRSGMRDDDTSTGGQWDSPMSKGSQGKWEQREGELYARAARTVTRPRLNGQHSHELLLIYFSLDDTGGRGGDTYTQQHLGQGGYDTGGGQTGTGPGSTDIQSDRTAARRGPARPLAMWTPPPETSLERVVAEDLTMTMSTVPRLAPAALRANPP